MTLPENSQGVVAAPLIDAAVTVRRVTLLESDLPKMVVTGWLGARTNFDVRIDGPFGAKEGAALLRLLAAQLEVLADEGGL